MISSININLFENTKILSKISEGGFTVVINGPQLLYEYNNDRHREFTGYTNAPLNKLAEIFSDNKLYRTIIDNEKIIIGERDKSSDTMYVFALESVLNVFSGIDFCKQLINSLKTWHETVMYEPSIGIVENEGNWEILERGGLPYDAELEKNIQNDPDALLEILSITLENPYTAFDDHIISVIRSSGDSVVNASPSQVKKLMDTIMKRNPSKIGVLEKLNILGSLIPELDAAFDTTENLPDYIYNSIGEGCIAAIDCLNDVPAWATMFYCAGKAVSPQIDIGEYSTAVEFTEKSMIIANDFLFKCGYGEEYIAKILSVLFLLDKELPEEYDETVSFILRNFNTKEKLDDFVDARFCISNMYSGKYRDSEIKKIGHLTKIAKSIEYAYIRSNINISDEKIKENASDRGYEGALLEIKKFLIDEPMFNDEENLIRFLRDDPIEKTADLSVKKLSPEVRHMMSERSQILRRMADFDIDKINKISFGREKQSEEEKRYSKEYFELSERLSSLNDELLKTDAFNDEERELVSRCQSMNKILKEKMEEQRFADSIFTDTDTSFFENLYHLMITQNEQ